MSNDPSRQRQRLGACPHVDGAAAALPGDRDLRGGGVEAHDLGAAARHAPGDLPLAAADVEDAPCPLEVASDQRQDLILVLGVGAGGELALPPARVTLPLRLVLHVLESSGRIAGVATVTVRG